MLNYYTNPSKIEKQAYKYIYIKHWNLIKNAVPLLLLLISIIFSKQIIYEKIVQLVL